MNSILTFKKKRKENPDMVMCAYNTGAGKTKISGFWVLIREQCNLPVELQNSERPF